MALRWTITPREDLQRRESGRSRPDRVKLDQAESQGLRSGLRITACDLKTRWRSQSLDLPDREKIIIIQRGLRQGFDFQYAVAAIPKRDCAGAVAKWQAVADGTEDFAFRATAWRKAAYTAPVQRDTDGDVQMTGVNATGFENKESKTTGNGSAKAGTAAKRVF
ncbi:hypothetical protein E4U32_005261 [Claviceps aff. humidiphila group G2b]|nr:hypothetical protein E4U32_005261 [Claviceps aff. humidiphila group G2b]